MYYSRNKQNIKILNIKKSIKLNKAEKLLKTKGLRKIERTQITKTRNESGSTMNVSIE